MRPASPGRPTGPPWTSRAAGSPRATCPATTSNYEAYLGSGDKGAASWCPAESDFSIQQIGDHNGWFYGANDSRKTAKELMDLYYKSVGRNSVFLMNVPPSDQGVIDDKEVKVIEAFTKMLEAVFTTNLADGATASATAVRGDNPDKYGPAKMLDGNYDSYFATNDEVKAVDIEFELAGSKTFNRVMLQEYIPLGQRVESFEIQVLGQRRQDHHRPQAHRPGKHRLGRCRAHPDQILPRLPRPERVRAL